jgi:hypothetical protein
MGFLTTLTIYNDGFSDIEANKEEFANGVIDAVRSFRLEPIDVRVGNFVNCVRVHPSRHAADHTVYVHRGNCVVEIRPYSDLTRELARRNPQFARNILQQLRRTCKELEAVLLDIEAESPADAALSTAQVSNSRKGRDTNGEESKESTDH